MSSVSWWTHATCLHGGPLMAWKSHQYHQNGWIDVFDRPWVVDVIDYLFSIHSDLFAGLLSFLYAGDTPVAAHFGLRACRQLAHWFPAYDARFGRHSPGLIQHLRMAEKTAAIGVHRIDLGTGGERYKQTLRSYDLFVSKGMVFRGPLVAGAHRVGQRLRRAGPAVKVRQHPPLYRAADQLLRRYGRIA